MKLTLKLAGTLCFLVAMTLVQGCTSLPKELNNKDIVNIRLHSAITSNTANQVVRQINQYNTSNYAIILNIKSVGGYVYAGDRIVRAIKRSNAHIRMKVDYFAYSYGAVLLCYANSYDIDSTASIMYHTPWSVRNGKRIYKPYSKVLNDPMMWAFNNKCYKYFNSHELKYMFEDGRNLYLNGNTFKRKFNRR